MADAATRRDHDGMRIPATVIGHLAARGIGHYFQVRHDPIVNILG